jgi:hypothetical protein
VARRRRTLTRDDLLHRYATINGLTYGEAHDRHGATNIECLRDIVESAEKQRREPYTAQRASFARSLPTTTIQGQTR